MYPTCGQSTNGIAVARQRKSLEDIGINVDLLHCRPNGRREWFRSLITLRRLASTGDYDIVHCHYGFTTTLLAMFQPLPVVVTFHGSDINGYPVTSWWDAHRAVAFSIVAWLARHITRWADAVIVMTTNMKRRLPLSVQAKTWVEPMGVDTTLFYPRSQEVARALLGWGPELVVLFCDTNEEPVKRRELAEAAVAHATEKIGRSVRLFVLRNIAPEEVPVFLNAANCLVVTSDREGSPNIVRESLACNLPVVSVAVGDVPQLLVTDPESGRIASGDPVALGDAIAGVVRRPRPNNLPKVIYRSTTNQIAGRVAEIYRLVLRRRTQARPEWTFD
jgi:glycosyltransferase involved in cell wall biosynthesis